MSINVLRDYLDNLNVTNDDFPFATNELNELLLVTYSFIKRCLRDECHIIEFLPQKIVWRRSFEGKICDSVEFTHLPINFHNQIKLILERDNIISQNVILEENTETSIKVFIK